MSGDSSKVEPPRSRQVLSDVTNYLAKRGFSFIGRDVGLKPVDVCGKGANTEDGDLHSAKQRRLVVENEKDLLSSKTEQICGSLHPFTRTDSSQNSITSEMPDMPRETKEISNSFSDHCNPASGNVTSESAVEVAGASKDSCASTASILTYSELSNCIGEYHEEQAPQDSTQSDHGCEGLVTCFGRTGVKDPGFGKLGSSNTGSADWLRLPKSQGSKVFSLSKCTGDNAEGHANLNDGAGVLGECTCSFCLKAAYIWSDLHYQDINGRIAALKKSQKEASILVQKSCRGKDVVKENSDQSSKLESDLTSQWRLLFLHMEDILLGESKQLQTSVVVLKDLRETCKKDLEMIKVTADKQ